MTVKHWYQSKTVWVNVLLFAIALAALFSSDPLFADYARYLVLAQSVLNLALRFLTNTAIAGTPAANGPAPIPPQPPQPEQPRS